MRAARLRDLWDILPVSSDGLSFLPLQDARTFRPCSRSSPWEGTDQIRAEIHPKAAA